MYIYVSCFLPSRHIPTVLFFFVDPAGRFLFAFFMAVAWTALLTDQWLVPIEVTITVSSNILVALVG